MANFGLYSIPFTVNKSPAIFPTGTDFALYHTLLKLEHTKNTFFVSPNFNKFPRIDQSGEYKVTTVRVFKQKLAGNKKMDIKVGSDSTSILITPINWQTVARALGVANGLRSLCQFLGMLNSAGAVIMDDGDEHTAVLSNNAFIKLKPKLVEA